MLTAPPQPADEQAVATIAAAIRRWEGEGDADYPDHEGTGRGYWGGAVEHTKPAKLVAVLSHSYTPHSSAPRASARPHSPARTPRSKSRLRVPAVPVDANSPNARRAQFSRGSSGSRGATASSANFLLKLPGASSTRTRRRRSRASASTRFSRAGRTSTRRSTLTPPLRKPCSQCSTSKAARLTPRSPWLSLTVRLAGTPTCLTLWPKLAITVLPRVRCPMPSSALPAPPDAEFSATRCAQLTWQWLSCGIAASAPRTTLTSLRALSSRSPTSRQTSSPAHRRQVCALGILCHVLLPPAPPSAFDLA